MPTEPLTVRERSKAYLLGDAWVRWPICPVKRWRGNELELGLIHAGKRYEVILGNLWFVEQALAHGQRLTYACLDDLLNDDWVVD